MKLNFLRTGLKKAVIQNEQKDAMLAQIKANAQEYEKEFKAQTQEFQSLKEQLQNAYDEIHRKNEDLKYKNLELIRFKERATIKEGDLQDQINVLTRKRGGNSKAPVAEINQYQYTPLSKNDPLEMKLKQALDKINEQGRRHQYFGPEIAGSRAKRGPQPIIAWILSNRSWVLRGFRR